MPRHRKECERGYAALRSGSSSRRSVLPRLRPGHVASHATRRPPRADGHVGPDGHDGARAGGRGLCQRCLGLARSLLVTPWFAAGAGIVIAAALAVDSPSALTYAPNGPGVRCAASGCPGTVPSRGPDLATATPGVPIASGATPGEGAETGPAGRGAPGEPGPAYQVGYEILRRWPSGFLAEITLPPNLKSGSWSLWLSFRSAHIDRVWGARWRPSGNGGSGTASGPWHRGQQGTGPGPDGPGSGRPGDRQLTISATGTPASPSGCSLDGKNCRFG